MKKTIPPDLFAVLLLALCFASLSSYAEEVSDKPLPVTFPSLPQAQVETAHLNDRIAEIKSGIEKATDEAAAQIKQHFEVKLENIGNEQQDELETEEEFKLRLSNERDELAVQRDTELAQLSSSANKQLEEETKSPKARIKALREHVYLLGAQEIEVTLGAYNPEKQLFILSLRSKIEEFQLNMKAAVPVPAELSSTFLQQWQAGAITPQAKVKFDGELDELLLFNSQDNSSRIAVASFFYTRAALSKLSPVALNGLFKIGNAFKDCSKCPEMLVIPAGSFDMGSNESGVEESPRHFVNIKQPFALGKTEITQEEWMAIMGTIPSYFNKCGTDCPVESVSWDDANEFVKKLSEKTGKDYRLPSEAEWEYACRAGSQQEYCGGDKVGEVAWYYRNSAAKSHPVKQKQPNAWGLYDMGGNVWEWVEDRYHDNYKGAPGDGSAWLAPGDGDTRVMRGGAWNLIPELLRTTVRAAGAPDLRDYYYGFRVARTLP